MANALYVGDDLKNDGIEVIGSAPGTGGEFVLIAVCIQMDRGRYQVRTFYSISREKIEARKAKGFLKVIP